MRGNKRNAFDERREVRWRTKKLEEKVWVRCSFLSADGIFSLSSDALLQYWCERVVNTWRHTVYIDYCHPRDTRRCQWKLRGRDTQDKGRGCPEPGSDCSETLLISLDNISYIAKNPPSYILNKSQYFSKLKAFQFSFLRSIYIYKNKKNLKKYNELRG